MGSIDFITLEVADPAAARAFYSTAFGLGPELQLRASAAPTSGFRGFTLSLTVAQPGNVHALIDAALAAGARAVKPVTKSFWGVGGVVQAPDGTLWKVATGAKKDSGPATRAFERIVLLLGAADVGAGRRFYVEHGVAVAKSFGRKYVEFDMPGPIGLGLYGRKALAKDAGVPPEGSGAHRIAIGGDLGTLSDPDGFAWEPARVAAMAG
jgi:catechol 2,3-dioxygenase-like lactoylglutathione lyase family enzyme